MVSKDYKVIFPNDIHVNGILRRVGEVFSEEETREIKNLVRDKYIEKGGNYNGC